MTDAEKYETEIDELDSAALREIDRLGHPSRYSCPECGGVLWETDTGKLVRYRCRVGHSYSLETLLDRQANNLEMALWAALKTNEEQIDLLQAMATRARTRGHGSLAVRFENRQIEARARAEVIRQVLLNGKENGPEEEP